jgi:hypothetical protein
METIVLNEMRERFNRAMWGHSGSLRITQEDLDTFKRRLSDMPSETVYFLGEIVTDESIGQSEHTLDRILIYMLGASGASDKELEDVAFMYLHRAIDREMVRDSLPQTSAHSIPSPLLRNALSGLRRYELDGFHYDSTVAIGRHDAATADKCIALMSVGRALIDMSNRNSLLVVGYINEGDTFISDQTLAQLIIDFAATSDRIPALLEERGGDVESVRAVLEAPSRALSEGTL